jgi:N-acetylglutamate synthase
MFMSIAKIIIREFRIKEYNTIIALWESSGLGPKTQGRDSHESIQLEMKNGIAIFLVAEVESKIIGTVLGTHDGRKGWINRLAVMPAYRKSGIAKMLVQTAEKKLYDRGIGIIACLIEPGNQLSLDVFSKLGYLEFSGMHYLTKRKFVGI